MKHSFSILIWPFCLILTLGCTARVGTRTADGTYLTFGGEAVNLYNASHDQTLQAGLQILSTMEMPIRGKRKMRDGIVILAGAPDGSTVRLQFVKEGRDITMLKVRTGRIGYWDHEFSYQLHALMKAELKRVTQQEPAQTPHSDLTTAVTSTGINTTISARKPALSGQSPPLTPESGKYPDNEDSEPKKAKTDVSAAAESLAPVEHVAGLPLTKPNATILFDADSNLPAEEELTKLDRIALQARSNLNAKIELTGFTGEFDNIDQAETLSKSRVMAVKYYLVGKGVGADKIVAVPRTRSIEEQTQNETYRRVEIRINTEP